MGRTVFNLVIPESTIAVAQFSGTLLLVQSYFSRVMLTFVGFLGKTQRTLHAYMHIHMYMAFLLFLAIFYYYHN